MTVYSETSKAAMQRDILDPGDGVLDFWDLDDVNPDLPLERQTDLLKEDLVQITFGSGIVVDAGWYPSFSPEGRFRIAAIRNGDWTIPLWEAESRDLTGLLSKLARAIAIGGKRSMAATGRILAEVRFRPPTKGEQPTLLEPPWGHPGSPGCVPHLLIDGGHGLESDPAGIPSSGGSVPESGAVILPFVYTTPDDSIVVPGATFSLRNWNTIVATGQVRERLSSTVPEPTTEAAHALLINSLHEALPRACQAQNMRWITQGRTWIWSLPRHWLIRNLPDVALRVLDLNEEWEYRRFLEVLHPIDQGLFERFIEMGASNSDPEIRETAADLREWSPTH